MSARTPCCVPFCGRTIATDKIAPDEEWVCGKHWALVPKHMRAAYTLTKRRVRKIVRYRPRHQEYWLYKAGSPDRISAHSMWMRLRSSWRRCRDAAIERAMGAS